MAKTLDPARTGWQACPGGGTYRAYDWPPAPKDTTTIPGVPYPGSCVCECSYGVIMLPGSHRPDQLLVSGDRADVAKVATHQVRFGPKYTERPGIREPLAMRYTGKAKVLLDAAHKVGT